MIDLDYGCIHKGGNMDPRRRQELAAMRYLADKYPETTRIRFEGYTIILEELIYILGWRVKHTFKFRSKNEIISN